jgi:hypothetical protein
MLNRKNINTTVLFLIVVMFTGVRAQTTEWRVVWDKNAAIDSVDYYNVYRETGSEPTTSNLIATVPQPTNPNQDSVVYVDQNIEPGTHYYYKVQAVDLRQRSSPLSESANAAIPKILLNTNMTFTAGKTNTLDLKNSQYVLDPDNTFAELNWSVTGGTQISIAINASNVATIITPADTTIQEGFVFTVEDPDEFSHKKTVTVSLAATQPPDIDSNPIVTAEQGVLYEYTVTAQDPDGDPLTFSLTQAPDFLSISSINASSALISGTPVENDIGSHAVTILVDDGFGGSDIQSYDLEVEETNLPPEIFSVPVLTATEGELYQYVVIAHDPNGDPLSFSFTSSPNFLSINALNDSTAMVSGIPGESDIGTHVVRIRAADDKDVRVHQRYDLVVQAASNGGPFHSAIAVEILPSGVVRITWNTRALSKDYVNYGPTAAYEKSSLMDEEFATSHERTLTGLLPNTPYHYQIVSEDENAATFLSPDSTFTTDEDKKEVVKAFPVPYNANEPNSYGGIYFEFPASEDHYTLMIYSLLGDLVYSVSDLSNNHIWQVVNSAGKSVNAGLYIYYIKDNHDTRLASGKLVIIR